MSNLLIIGASVRAAVKSAAATPWNIYAMDMFGDLDTRAGSRFELLSPYPERVFKLLEETQVQAACITGALENHPQLLQKLGQKTELLAPPVDQIQRLRDTFDLQQRLTNAGFRFPLTLPLSTPPDLDRHSWLIKPKASAAGQGISSYNPSQEISNNTDNILQQQIIGRSISATLLTHPKQTLLLGVTEQLTGLAAFNAPGFQYCGSIGPLNLATALEDQLQNLGSFLQREYQLRGLIGVDLILKDDQLWVIEINPRYTASMELLEASLGYSLIQLHIDSFSTTPPEITNRRSVGRYYGKAVLYTVSQVTLPTTLSSHWERSLSSAKPEIADLPAIGSTISKGHPLFTVFAESVSAEETLGLLQQRADKYYAMLA